MCFIFHEWTKWEQYTETGIEILGLLAPKNMRGKEVRYNDLRQRRVCKKCGKMEDTLVKGTC